MDLSTYQAQIRQDLLIQSHQREIKLELSTTWGLFSPREIDEGSALLLKYVEVDSNHDCLDLGCGYGILGLTLAKLAPMGQSLLVDKDFLAVEYSQKNALRNGITNSECLLSNGFSAVLDKRFDLIVSNIPAKVGKEMLYLYLFDALSTLNPGGRFYVVTINGLREFFKRAFIEVFGNYKKVKQGKSYTVAFAEKP